MGKNDFQTVVEMSRKFNAREAGQDVAKKTLNKLEHSPNFILLFSTIHYDNHGGFQELLNGVWDILPEHTPLIGGTIAGFMNQYGCFTRGVAILAVWSKDIDVEVGVGHNTKRNPKKAVNECFSNFNKDDNDFNEFFIEVVSGPEIPNFPKIGRQTVVKSKTGGAALAKILPMLSVSNMGIDRADEILNQIVIKNSNSKLIGVVCLDDRRLFKNYQFLNKDVLKEALCLLRIRSRLNFKLNTAFGLKKKEGVKVDIDIGNDKHLISKINNNQATEELYRIIGIDSENVGMIDRFYSQAFYYPFGYDRDNFIHACMLGGILGEKVYFANQVNDKKLSLYELTGKQILKSTEDLFSNLSENTSINFSVMCETYIETMGRHIYKIYDMIKYKTQKPFLIVFAGGESIYYGDGTPHHLYESLNNLIL